MIPRLLVVIWRWCACARRLTRIDIAYNIAITNYDIWGDIIIAVVSVVSIQTVYKQGVGLDRMIRGSIVNKVALGSDYRWPTTICISREMPTSSRSKFVIEFTFLSAFRFAITINTCVDDMVPCNCIEGHRDAYDQRNRSCFGDSLTQCMARYNFLLLLLVLEEIICWSMCYVSRAHFYGPYLFY